MPTLDRILITTLDSTNYTRYANVSSSHRDPLYRVVSVLVFLPLVVLTGIVGNAAVLTVIARVRRMRTPIYYCFASLAVSDLMVLIVTPLIPIREILDLPGSAFGRILCYVCTGYLEHVASTATILNTLLVTLERFVALTFPLKAQSLITKRTTFVAICCVWTAALVTSVPYVMMARYQRAVYKPSTVLWCISIFATSAFHRVYKLAAVTLLFFGPTLIITVLNAAILRSMVIKSLAADDERELRRNKRSADETRAVARMIVGIDTVFLLTIVPFRVLIFALVVSGSDIFSDEGMAIFMWSGRILTYANSASNPILYCIFSSKFRQMMIESFRCRRYKRYTAAKMHETTNTNVTSM